MVPHDLLSLGRLMRSQWLTPVELQGLQENKLRRLIAHAYDRVPYYRRLFDGAGLKPEDIRGIADLAKIPLTTKAQLLEQPLTDITARGINLRRCRVTTTSGTTGVPFRIYYRRKDLTRVNFGWVRTYLAHGMKVRHRIAAFGGWGHEDIKKRRWYEHFGLWRRLTLPAGETAESWIAELRRWRPQVILGYVMTLNLLAEAIAERNIRGIRPKMIFHTSGLLHPRDRESIGRALGSEVVDIYGSDEGGCIAWECPVCAGYHINVDLLALEIVEDGRAVPPGSPGEVVITNLHSYAMPLIRYRQGDQATLSPDGPTCGRGLPLLNEIQGRIDDFIVLPSGKRISPHPVYWALLLVPGISEWRVIQDRRDSLRVEVVAGKDFPGEGPSLIEANLKKIVKDEAKIDVSVLDAIERNPAQKFRSVISKVRNEN